MDYNPKEAAGMLRTKSLSDSPRLSGLNPNLPRGRSESPPPMRHSSTTPFPLCGGFTEPWVSHGCPTAPYSPGGWGVGWTKVQGHEVTAATKTKILIQQYSPRDSFSLAKGLLDCGWKRRTGWKRDPSTLPSSETVAQLMLRTL